MAYGGLSMPLAMIGYPIAIWLIPFYSEVTKFQLALLADLLLIARFTDVITDPLIGQWGDSTKTRFGRRKPWIILGVPLMLYSVYKLFMPGEDVTVAYFLIWIMLMYLGSTAIGIPYGAWGAEISSDYHQRSRVVSGREAFVLIGLLISALIPLGVEVSGNNISISEGLSRTFSAIFFFQDFSSSNQMREILGYMGLGIILILPIFAAIAIWKVPDPMPKIEKKIPLKQGLKYAMENPLLIRILAIIFLVIAGESFRNTLSLWFVRDVIGIETVGASYARYFIAGFIAIPFWLWLGKVLGKHRAFCITLVGTGTVSFLCFFFRIW